MNYKDIKNIVSYHFTAKVALNQPNVILLYLDVITEISDQNGKVQGYWVSTDIAMKQIALFEIQENKDSIILDIKEAAKLRDQLNQTLAHTIYAKQESVYYRGKIYEVPPIDPPIFGDPTHENP